MWNDFETGAHQQRDKRELTYLAEERDRKSRAREIGPVAIWLERIIKVALAAAVVSLFVVLSFSESCDTTIMDVATITWAPVTIGLVAYLARLYFPHRRRWFHLAFVLILIVASLAFFFVFLQAVASALGDGCPTG